MNAKLEPQQSNDMGPMSGAKDQYRYEIRPRPIELGGGWNLKLFKDNDEMGGGVFPLDEYSDFADRNEALKFAYSEALSEGEAWLMSR